jgi:hypothetical protein
MRISLRSASPFLAVSSGLLMLVAPPLVSRLAAANLPVVLDSVNVGADVPSGRTDGFGPPEPTTHPGVWGHQTGDFWRVVWFPNDQPTGDVRLNVPAHTRARTLQITYLNGTSGCFGSPLGDTFDVYVARDVGSPTWAHLGTVVWDPAACGPEGEQLRDTSLNVVPPGGFDDGEADGDDDDGALGGGSKGKQIIVRFVSAAGVANQPWTFFNPFGQVAIHSVALAGDAANGN